MLKVASLPERGVIEDGLGRLLRACNSVVKGFGQPLLYGQDGEAGFVKTRSKAGTQPRKKRKEAPRTREEAATSSTSGPDVTHHFHISIAWTLDDPQKSSGLAERLDVEMEGMEMGFSCVKVKIGNVVHDIPLV